MYTIYGTLGLSEGSELRFVATAAFLVPREATDARGDSLRRNRRKKRRKKPPILSRM